MANRLAGQVAWISGGASGMGEATARLFAAEGAAVAIIDVQRERGEALAAEIASAGGRAMFVAADVSREMQVADSIAATVARFGGLQIVVNCAGVVHVKLLHETSEAEWDLLMAINVKSIFFSIKHALPHLRKQPRSYMVNIGSIGSFIGQGLTPVYTTSKGAVLQLSRSIALDYAVHGLRCNCVCPGITDTPMLRFHLSSTPDAEATLRQRLRRVPMGVALTPEDIAKAVLYLACEDSSGVTGTSLVVDGGYLAAAEWQTNVPTAFMDAP
jgi:NAD(P)-dependent dehydrogenase (short-subunit alcohol dehydrogenase family)